MGMYLYFDIGTSEDDLHLASCYVFLFILKNVEKDYTFRYKHLSKCNSSLLFKVISIQSFKGSDTLNLLLIFMQCFLLTGFPGGEDFSGVASHFPGGVNSARGEFFSPPPDAFYPPPLRGG